MSNHNGGNSGMPLQEYSKAVPPGWRAGSAEYPLKRYLELLELWVSQTDLEATKLGAAVAGRLGGRVQTLAIHLTITKRDLSVVRGMAALAFQGEPADPAAQPPQAATPTGLQALIQVLKEKYGATDQDQQGVDLDDLLDLRRGRRTLMEYLIEFEHRYDKA